PTDGPGRSRHAEKKRGEHGEAGHDRHPKTRHWISERRAAARRRGREREEGGLLEGQRVGAAGARVRAADDEDDIDGAAAGGHDNLWLPGAVDGSRPGTAVRGAEELQPARE